MGRGSGWESGWGEVDVMFSASYGDTKRPFRIRGAPVPSVFRETHPIRTQRYGERLSKVSTVREDEKGFFVLFRASPDVLSFFLFVSDTTSKKRARFLPRKSVAIAEMSPSSS